MGQDACCERCRMSVRHGWAGKEEVVEKGADGVLMAAAEAGNRMTCFTGRQDQLWGRLYR